MGLTPPELGWSRGCGNGIGYSAHKNDYQAGVAINNFLEDRAHLDMQKAGVDVSGIQQPGSFSTCYRGAYSRSAEEYARALQGRTAEIPRQLIKEDKGKKAIFDQEDPAGDEAPDPYTTISSLAFATPCLGKNSLQTELWSGQKSNDLGITLREKKSKARAASFPAPGSLLAEKTKQWARDCVPERKSKYATATASFSADVAARAAIAAAAAVADGRSAAPASAQADVAARAAAAGAEAPMVGRKAKGEFVDAADLQERMFRKMHFRHPVLHTVRWQTQAQIDAAAAAKSSAAQAAAMAGASASAGECGITGVPGACAEKFGELGADAGEQ